MSLPRERELIRLLTEETEPQRNRAGFDSDCAIVPLGETEIVLTTDTFAAGTHFPPGTPPGVAARMATEATISDLAAAGAEVLGLLAGYGLPPDLTRAQVRDVGQQVAQAVQAHGGEVLGGDTKPRGELEVSMTAVGTCPAGAALTRAGARPGDRLVCSGPLGGAGAALDRVKAGLDPRRADPLLAPRARVEAGRALVDAGATACVDLSDGLADGAVAIAEASRVEVVLDREAIELHPWAADEDAGLAWALSTGGDYELLAAVPEDAVERVHTVWMALDLSPAVVGRVQAGSGAVLDTGQGTRALSRGYEHAFDSRA